VDRVSQVEDVATDQLRDSEEAVEREMGLEQPNAAFPKPVFRDMDVAWLLWGERRFLTRITVRGIIAFLVLALILPKRYTATAQLMPPDYNSMSQLAMSLPSLSTDTTEGGGGGGGKTSGLMGIASSLLGLNSSGQLFVGVLQSRTIEDDIINNFGLMELYSVRYPEDARKKLEKVTEITVDDKTGILSIAVEDKDPKRAAAMTQAYVEDLNKVLATVNTSAAHRERVFIEKRRAEMKNELDEAAKQFSEFASQNTAIDIPEQAKAMVSAAADLQAQLITTQSILSSLQEIYTDSNPRVRQMKAQVAELERQLNKVGGKDVITSTGTVLGPGELYPSIRQLPLLGVRYLDLLRRNEIDEAVYELLTKEYEMAALEEARDVPTAQVLDSAVTPQKKTSPHRAYIVLGGMCFSFASGIAWILSCAYWRRTDPQLAWKVFAQEVFLTFKANVYDSRLVMRIRAMVVRMRTLTPRKSTKKAESSGSNSSSNV